MTYRFFVICTLLAFLTACSPAVPTPSPSIPDPSVTPSLVQPTAQPLQPVSASPTPEIGSPAPEFTPTAETTYTLEPTITITLPPLPTLSQPTMEATSIPQPLVGSGAIQFYGPGPLSKLVSKVPFYGYAIPGFYRKGNVYLYGEDGRLLDSELLQLNTFYTWAYFAWTLDFEVPAPGELGRLTMVTRDVYERLTAVNSVHLLLLSEGYSVVNPPGDLRERCVIDLPVSGRRLSGGIVAVAGEMRPFSSVPLVVELIDRNGNVLASQPAAVSPAPDDSYVPFSVNLPYSISSGTWALLSVSQADDRIPGMMYLYSREIYLFP